MIIRPDYDFAFNCLIRVQIVISNKYDQFKWTWSAKKKGKSWGTLFELIVFYFNWSHAFELILNFWTGCSYLSWWCFKKVMFDLLVQSELIMFIFDGRA